MGNAYERGATLSKDIDVYLERIDQIRNSVIKTRFEEIIDTVNRYWTGEDAKKFGDQVKACWDKLKKDMDANYESVLNMKKNGIDFQKNQQNIANTIIK